MCRPNSFNVYFLWMSKMVQIKQWLPLYFRYSQWTLMWKKLCSFIIDFLSAFSFGTCVCVLEGGYHKKGSVTLSAVRLPNPILMYWPMNQERWTVPLFFSSIRFLTTPPLSFHPENAPLLQTAFWPPEWEHRQTTNKRHMRQMTSTLTRVSDIACMYQEVLLVTGWGWMVRCDTVKSTSTLSNFNRRLLCVFNQLVLLLLCLYNICKTHCYCMSSITIIIVNTCVAF